MATPFEDTPKWFNANHYLDQKAVQMQAADPAGNWTREKVISDFAAHGIDNPYDHYKAFGDVENLTPNALFNNTEYLAAKAAMMGSTWTVEMVAKAIHDAGLTLMEHYIQYGGKYENLSPSSDFDQDKYFDAKLQANIVAEPDKGWTLDMVKADFAAAGISALEHFLTYGAMEGLDKYDYSENGAPIPHPGSTNIQLTKGADIATPDATVAELKTSDRDDTIHALAGSSTTSTLNAGDVIDGGAGVDNLIVNMQQTFNGFTKGSMKGVEQVVLQNAGNVTFKAVNVEGVKNYVVDGSEKGGVTIESVESAMVNYNLKMDKGNFTAKIADSALTGKTDDVYMILNGVGSDAKDNLAEITVKGMTSGEVEGLTLDVQGKENYVKIAEGHKTLTVDGTGNLDVSLAKSGLTTFDASDATGKVVANLTNASASLKTVTGGQGDDSITVGNAALAGTVFSGGDGNDTLTFTVDPTLAAKPTISGFEKIVLTDATNTLNGTNISDVTEILLKGTSPAATISRLSNTELTLSTEGAAGALVYEGKGNLTFQNVDSDGKTNDIAVTSLTADGVENLKIANMDTEGASGALTVSIVNAKLATSLTVDTGEFGVTLDKVDLRSADTITVTGEGPFTFNAATGNLQNLKEINASELTGVFDFDLSAGKALADAKIGLTIYGSSTEDNTVTGTTGKDIIKFTGGIGDNVIYGGVDSDVITLAGSAGVNVAYAATSFASMAAEAGTTGDIIKGFDSGVDVIQFAEGLLNVAGAAISVASGDLHELDVQEYTMGAATVAQNYANLVTAGNAPVIEIMNEYTGNGDLHAATVALAHLNNGSTAVVASTMKVVFSITDGEDTYLWYFDGSKDATDAAASSGMSDTELTLIGVLDGMDTPGALANGDFAILGA